MVVSVPVLLLYTQYTYLKFRVMTQKEKRFTNSNGKQRNPGGNNGGGII